MRKTLLNENGQLERICGENYLGLGFECFLIHPLIHSFFWSTLHCGCLRSWVLTFAMVLVICDLPMLSSCYIRKVVAHKVIVLIRLLRK